MVLKPVVQCIHVRYNILNRLKKSNPKTRHVSFPPRPFQPFNHYPFNPQSFRKYLKTMTTTLTIANNDPSAKLVSQFLVSSSSFKNVNVQESNNEVLYATRYKYHYVSHIIIKLYYSYTTIYITYYEI